MFKPLRRKGVIKITMWLLIITFVIWGAGSLSITNKNYAGIMFGKKISPQEYSRSYAAVLNRAKTIYGDQLSKIQNFLNLKSQAWDRLILLYYAKKKLIFATNKEVVTRIASMPFFQNSGAFDKNAYSYIVQNVFAVTPRDFEESVREDIIISKVVDSVEKGITVTNEEAETAYKTKNEKADISYILITSDFFKKDVSADEADLEPFYNSNKGQFKTQEKTSVFYVNIPFDEKDAAKKEEAKQMANDINDHLNVGDDFQGLVKKYNLKIEETGPFSFTEPPPQMGLLYSFSVSAFGLSKEKPNALVEEKNAFYVMKLKEKMAPYVPAFSEAKERVRNALIDKKADELAKKSAENFAKLLKSGKDSFENLSKQLNVPVNEARDVTREGYAEQIGPNEEFNRACFSIKENEFAGPLRVQSGYAIIRLNKLKPIDKEKFEKEKQSFKSTILEEKKKKAFTDWFSKLKEKAKLKTQI